jgi:lipoyl(octanoyl) transferase
MKVRVMIDWVVTKWQQPIPYIKAWDAMKAQTEARTAESKDELWLMQHHPVYTQGLAGRAEHVLNPKNIPVVKTDRGGQVTYHGPGQLMLYSLFDIDRLGLGTRDYVRRLEQVVIDVLKDYKVTAQGRVDAPGVYVDDKKICSIGLRVKKGRSYHGCALNVAGDLEPFQGINPCGFNTLKMTCIEEHAAVTLDDLVEKVCLHFARQFGFGQPMRQDNQGWQGHE